MIFSAKSKLHNAFIDGLDEPVFVFGANGAFQDSNAPARDVLKTLGYPEGREPESYEAFLKILRLVGTGSESPVLSIGEDKYETLSKKTDGATLLRLMPLREDPHLSRLAVALEIMPWGLITVELNSPQKKNRLLQSLRRRISAITLYQPAW